MQEKTDWSVQISKLKSERVVPFTRDPSFNGELENLFNFIRVKIDSNKQTYSTDWAWVGLGGLVFNIVRKAARLWDIFIEDKGGKEKLDDEFEDNLMIAVYSILYYRMLQKKEQNDN